MKAARCLRCGSSEFSESGQGHLYEDISAFKGRRRPEKCDSALLTHHAGMRVASCKIRASQQSAPAVQKKEGVPSFPASPALTLMGGGDFTLPRGRFPSLAPCERGEDVNTTQVRGAQVTTHEPH